MCIRDSFKLLSSIHAHAPTTHTHSAMMWMSLLLLVSTPQAGWQQLSSLLSAFPFNSWYESVHVLHNPCLLYTSRCV